MSNGNHVRPGEVISSSLINQILDRIEALEQSAPGPGPDPGPGPIVITGFDPANEQEVGRVLAVLGTMPFPATGDTVTIGGVPVPEANLRLAPSNRERLEFVIPDIGAVAAGGRNVFVRVSAGSNTAQRLYRVLPSAGGPPTPTIISVRPVGGAAGDIVPEGQTAIIAGTNFSADAANNTITFRPLGFSPTAPAYPRAGDPPLTVSSTSAGEIRVEVPDFAEITAAMGARGVRVEITVDGAPDPATFEFETVHL